MRAPLQLVSVREEGESVAWQVRPGRAPAPANFREMGSIDALCRGTIGESLVLSVIAARVFSQLWGSVFADRPCNQMAGGTDGP